MQGNIVAYEGKPVYVVALHNYDDVGIADEMDGEETLVCAAELDPIPLTTDIMRKFRIKRGKITHDQIDDRWYFYIDGNYILEISKEILYLHQLQQQMKLSGIEGEIRIDETFPPLQPNETPSYRLTEQQSITRTYNDDVNMMKGGTL